MKPVRILLAICAAAFLASCAGAYVAVDGGAHGPTIRTGQDGSRQLKD